LVFDAVFAEGGISRAAARLGSAYRNLP